MALNEQIKANQYLESNGFTPNSVDPLVVSPAARASGVSCANALFLGESRSVLRVTRPIWFCNYISILSTAKEVSQDKYAK